MFVRAATLKYDPHRGPRGGDIQKMALSDSKILLKNVFRAFGAKSHTPRKVDFVDVRTPFPRQGGPPEKNITRSPA